MTRRNSSRKEAVVAEEQAVEIAASLEGFERDIYLAVIKAAVQSINVVFPVSEALIKPHLYQGQVRGALCLAAMVVKEHRKMEQAVLEDLQE